MKLFSWTSIFHFFIISIPFSLIFELSGVKKNHNNFFVFALQIIRIIDLYSFRLPLTALKNRKISLGTIFEIFWFYLLLSHVIACIFINIAINDSAKHETWLRWVPAPRDNPLKPGEDFNSSYCSIYIHSLYWNYVTTSHIGVGDVLPTSNSEKLFTAIVIMITTIYYFYLVGTIASIFEELSPALQSNFETAHKQVLPILKSINEENEDLKVEQIQRYFDYIWITNKGFNENKFYSTLPENLKIDIQFERYRNIFLKSSLFIYGIKQLYNSDIANSVIKFFEYDIYLDSDTILLAGQTPNKLFLIVDGYAEIIDFELKTIRELKPGDYFGCIIPGEKYPGFVQTKLLYYKAAKYAK